MALCFALLKAMPSYAQGNVEYQILNELHDEGFEDIKLQIVGDTLFAQVEDRAHRGTFRGAATAIRRTAERHDEVRHFQLVLTDYKMPQLLVRASKREGIWDVSVDRDMNDVLRRLRTRPTMHSSTGCLDITVFPMVSLLNNKYDHFFDWSVRLAPAFAMTLWKGSRLTLQAIFPIAHRLDKDDHKRYIQVGNTNLSQQIVSNKHWYVSAAVGAFYSERWGVQAKGAYHVTRNLDLYVDAGYTGSLFYDANEGFGFGKLRRLNVMAGANYYEPWSKLEMNLALGQFVFGDKGGRLDVTRHFCEYSIGLYGIWTSHEFNYGFHFAIPMGGKRQKRNGVVRLRLPEYYAMEYLYDVNGRYFHERMGESYVTQPDQNHSSHYFQPAFVENYVRRTLNEGFDLSKKEKAEFLRRQSTTTDNTADTPTDTLQTEITNNSIY